MRRRIRPLTWRQPMRPWPNCGRSAASCPMAPCGPFPKAVEDIAANLEKATGPVPFETIRQEIRKLGPLTHHGDGNIRGPAKQLMGVLADVLDTAPGTNTLLKQANANFRREMAVKDMDDWLKPGHGIVSKDRFNREKINVATLFGKLDKTIADDSLFRGSFTPEDARHYRLTSGSSLAPRTCPRGCQATASRARAAAGTSARLGPERPRARAASPTRAGGGASAC